MTRLPALLLAAVLPLASGNASAAPAPAPHPAVRPLTTAQIADWLCRGLAGNDGRKLAATLFDGKLNDDADKEGWSAFVMADGRDYIDVTFMGMELLDDVGAWVLVIELEGDWHGIPEEDWVALARRIPGRVEPADHRGHKICLPDRRGCEHAGGYEARPGVRWLQVVWRSSVPHPSTYFCPQQPARK